MNQEIDSLYRVVLVAFFKALVVSGLCVFFQVKVHAQSFNGSGLNGESVLNATALCFGPDDRLYVMQQDGLIHAYTIVRNSPNNYAVTATESIQLVKQITNHNDNGSIHSTQKRQSTGLTVTGTALNPVIYVTSSDYRIGGIFDGGDKNLDTNSGMISRLSWNGNSWERVDLVRGLPRSEENHATNDIIYDSTSNTLYVAQGGNTNQGGPSFALAYLCEFALSAAILSVDLDSIEQMPILTDTSDGSSYVYNLPTVDDPTRSNANGIDDPMAMGYDGIDLHDPFGGNDGLNQAKLVEDSPVQIYAGGFRNVYDMVLGDSGKMYAWDNGPNPAYGNIASNEGFGTATNNHPGEGGVAYNIDGLHIITPGYYAGHPNPIRGNPDSAGLFTFGTSGIFRTEYVAGNPDSSLPYDWPPISLSLANPVEGDYQIPGTEDPSVYTRPSTSINGICIYEASNFGGSMTGDLISASYVNHTLYRIKLNAIGEVDHPDSVVVLASGDANFDKPLDVVCRGDGELFGGTIWVANHDLPNHAKNITILEPADFFVCTGIDNYVLDDDGDLFTNGDEIDNGTNPCNAVDTPSDHDGTLIGGFLVSDLNDPDDDDDGINDTLDYFPWDPQNGLGMSMPLEYPLFTYDPGVGFYGLGFTGLMSNGTDDYLDLWKTEDNSNTSIIAGGAAGLLVYVAVDTGDALGSINNQANAFQFGVEVDSLHLPFIYEATILGPVFPDSAEDFQSMGIFIGTGDQDNYVKIVINANGGDEGVAVVTEDNGIPSTTQYDFPGIGAEESVRIALIVNPANGFVRAQYAYGMNDLADLGDGFYVEGDLLERLKDSLALAIGLISTSRGSESMFNATWDHLSLRLLPETRGHWYTLQDATDCQPLGQPGSCCQGRHEAAFVQSGDKFYLLGGRENGSNVNIYDPVTDIWTSGANPPGNSLHHFQAVDYHGLIMAAGAFSGSWPEESAVDVIRVYNPLTNTWHAGPAIPVSRRRGSAGATIRNDTLFLLGGLTNGHLGGSVRWLDAYDMHSDTWTSLPDAPHKRDHFHLVHHDSLLVAAAGRRTSLPPFDSMFLSTEPKADVYDIHAGTWTFLEESIPTPRAANAAAVLNGEVIIIGGERESGPSKYNTEALNLATGTWRTLDSLNYPRNGTQALVNNDGIYVASGARERAGGQLTRTVESFHFYGQQPPVLAPTVASELVENDHDFGEVPIEVTASVNLFIYNNNGNQAILLHSLSMSDSSAFVLDTTLTFPRFLKPGDSLEIPVLFHPAAVQLYSDTIYIQHTGSDAPLSKIILDGEGIFNWLGDTRAFVDSSATGTGLGTSWEDAFTTVQAALNAAAGFPQITEVWIAEGVYKPGASRASSFVLRDSLTLYGGFHGTEILLGQRDVEAFPVIFSGDIGVQGDSTDNVYHVVFMNGTADTATIDGVTISHGLANGMSPMDRIGAGVLNFGLMAIRNCIITNCVSTDPGSALANDGIQAMLSVEDTEFTQNSDPELLNQNGGTIRWQGTSGLED